MTGSTNKDQAKAAAGEVDLDRTTGPPVVSSSDLLAGGRELVIRHGPDLYRLLITSQNKLILTK